MKCPAWFKSTCRYLGIVTLVIAGSLAIGYFTPRRWPPLFPRDCSQARFPVYLAADTMHVNLILPLQNPVYDWRQRLDIQAIGSQAETDYRYLKFGWGDRGFYMETPSWGEMRPSNALRALFRPGNPTVLYVQGYKSLPQEAGTTLRCVALDRQDYFHLAEFVNQSFQSNSQGQKIRLKDGYETTSGFYAARGHYSILRTCNTWSAEALEAGQVNTPLWPGLASSVMFHLGNGCQCQP